MKKFVAGVAVLLAVVSVGVVGVQMDEARADDKREAMVSGAYLSWWVQTECAKGSAACDVVLREANDNPHGVRFFEDGTAVFEGDAAGMNAKADR